MLRGQLENTKRQKMVSTPMRVVLQNFAENTCIDRLTTWDFDISEYENVTAEKRPELLTATQTSGAINRYRCMQLSDAATY